MIPYIYIEVILNHQFKRADWIHPAIQLSLMLGSLGNEDPAMGCSNLTAEKWTFLCKAAVKTGFEWSGYRVGVGSIRNNIAYIIGEYRCHCY